MSEAVDRWLIFAREDLRVAEVVLDECVEKALKGALARQGRVPPRTHSITDLLGLFSPEWLADLRADLVGLDDFYIPTRYPDALPGVLPDALPGRAEAEFDSGRR